MSITSEVKTETHLNLVVPIAPYDFAKQIEWSQPKGLYYTHNILFNKGRYFETSIYDKELLEEVSRLTNIPIQHNNMIVGSWKQLEDFVIAMNICNYRVKISIDWI